jgi:CO/xanthine dehydrogenase Mo-binding subunit
MTERWVGRAIPQIDIEAKLRGQTEYVGDLSVPNMVPAAIVRSPVAHGRIRRIDTSRAERVPGVLAVATAADAPDIAFGPYTPDWEILARRKVRFVGDEVAAVAALDDETARYAAGLVEVDIEELPPVFDPFDAMELGEPVLWDEHPNNVSTTFTIERGDVASAFEDADLVLEDVYATSRMYHAYLEPIGVIAQYERGSYLLHVPSHIPYRARQTYAAALGVTLDKVRLVVPPIGGSFGAKYEMNTPLIAALLARKAGRPVRILFGREEDAAYEHPRPPFVFRNRIAVRADGTFVGRETDVVGVAGARTYWSPAIVATAVHRVDSLYNFRSMRGRGRLVYTNEPPTTAMRGFGNAEALFGIEQMIDEIGERLRIDPVELRLRNAVKEGETSLHGWYISSSKLPECIHRARQMSDYDNRRRAQPPQPHERKGVLRGTGFAIGHHVSGYRAILADYDGSSAILRLGGDGSIQLFVGEPDIGQGHVTILAQLVADELGLNPSDVQVHGIDSALSPAAVGTLASRAATMSGMAVLEATADARRKLVGFVSEQWQVAESAVTWDDGMLVDSSGVHESLTLRQALHQFGVANCGLPLLAQGVHHPKTVMPDATKYGNASPAYPFAAHVAEVEVDCDTGQVAVVGYWAAHDSGTILNPQTARGQVLGGIAQGLGWALMEDVIMKDGVVRNPNFLDYRIPGAGDMPPVVQVEFVEGYEPNGPQGAKSVGEVALNPVIAAIANAVYNATGLRCKDMPISSERLWRYLHSDEPVQSVSTGRL